MTASGRWRRRARAGDEGFSLVEVVVALLLISLCMVSAVSFFTKSLATSAYQEQRQAAAVLVDQTLETARSLGPDKIIDGRDVTSVTAQHAAATRASLGPVTMLPAVTALLTLTPTATPPLPLSQTTKVGNTTYTVRTYVDGCIRAVTANAACLSNPTAALTSTLALNGSATLSPTARVMLRVTVSVQWPGHGGGCTVGGSNCEVLGTTLIDVGLESNDPTFPNGVSS